MNSHEEAIAQFMSLTGSEMSTAKYWLEASNWDLQQAMNLYFEGGNDTTQPVQQQQKKPTTTTLSTKQQQKKQVDEKLPRSPIPQKVQRLYENYDFDRERFGGFRSDMPQYMKDMLGMDNFPVRRRDKPKSEIESKFDRLFAEPKKILFKGSLEQAIDEAIKLGKWLLVNLQSPNEFDALRLNRDTWSNEVVQNIISTFFVFWQVAVENPEGKRFKDFYEIKSVPFIGIIDPKTSEIVKKYEGFQGPDKMIDELQTFVETMEIKSKTEETKKVEPSTKMPTVQEPLDYMTEDEMLRLAMQASLEQYNSQSSQSETMSIDDQKQTEQETKKEEKGKDILKPKVYMDPTPYLSDSPQGTTRVQLRYPDGKRQVHRLKVDTPLAALYGLFQAGLDEQDKHRPFTILFGTNVKLENTKDLTLEDAKATNASLALTFE